MMVFFFFGRAVQVTTVQVQANVEGLFCTHAHKTYATHYLHAANVEWRKDLGLQTQQNVMIRFIHGKKNPLKCAIFLACGSVALLVVTWQPISIREAWIRISSKSAFFFRLHFSSSTRIFASPFNSYG